MSKIRGAAAHVGAWQHQQQSSARPLTDRDPSADALAAGRQRGLSEVQKGRGHGRGYPVPVHGKAAREHQSCTSARDKIEDRRELNPGRKKKHQISSNRRELGLIFPPQVSAGVFAREAAAVQRSPSCRRLPAGQGHTWRDTGQRFILLLLSKYRYSSPSLLPDTFVPGIYPYLQLLATPKDFG